MGLLAAAAGVHAPPVLLVRSFGNGAGLLVQQRVHGRDLTNLDGERLDQARLADLWQQVAGLRASRIAHRDLGLSSVMVDERDQMWLVDFDRAEAAASQALLDRDAATLLAALDGVADPALVRATAPSRPSVRTRSDACCRRRHLRRPPPSRRPQRPDETRPSARAPILGVQAADGHGANRYQPDGHRAHCNQPDRDATNAERPEATPPMATSPAVSARARSWGRACQPLYPPPTGAAS
jgi:hypothetical protein